MNVLWTTVGVTLMPSAPTLWGVSPVPATLDTVGMGSAAQVSEGMAGAGHLMIMYCCMTPLSCSDPNHSPQQFPESLHRPHIHPPDMVPGCRGGGGHVQHPLQLPGQQLPWGRWAGHHGVSEWVPETVQPDWAAGGQCAWNKHHSQEWGWGHCSSSNPGHHTHSR